MKENAYREILIFEVRCKANYYKVREIPKLERMNELC